MIVVPVIDLKGGAVVRARGGERRSYRPIETPLARGSKAVDVVRGLMSIYSFSTLYVADLDAIEGSGDNASVLTELREAFPRLTLWVDNGAAEIEAVEAIVRAGWGIPVIGSESQRDVALVMACARAKQFVLSLDFRQDRFEGPEQLMTETHLWPDTVIVMTLARVGTAAGPDFARIAAVLRLAGERKVFAAGGVRNRRDLDELRDSGVTGALMATALHDGSVTRADIEWVSQSPRLHEPGQRT
jgi:phosphoribosylformimino-5-aminoimidazole carboxamide ribotide isomerase